MSRRSRLDDIDAEGLRRKARTHVITVLSALAAGLIAGLAGVPALAQLASADTGKASAYPLIETPELKTAVAKGKLPPVTLRVPDVPRVVDPRKRGGTLGRHGGTMRWLMGKQKDIRMVVYYGYARLVCFNERYEIEPDILDRVDVEQSRIFTLHLRPGHKWSDGHPFTAEDFRYFWDDVANDKSVGKGIPAALLVNGEAPKFEVIDPLTVRYSWTQPNADFLPALAATLPLTIALPAHYLKQFHPKYTDPATLKARVKEANVRNAKSLHIRKSRISRPENPDLPVLDAWMNTTKPPSSLFVFKRNPFFHRIDPAGRQLPYVDQVHIALGSTSLIPAKTGTGDSDLQARYLRFDDYTFLRAAQREGKIKVHLWRRANGSHIAILPNLNVEDPVWRDLNRDARFRKALSHAINRAEINAAIFYGLANESANTVLPESPLFREAYASAHINYDPERANALLDELGLERRDYDGIRLLPDGRRAEIILESAGESSEQADVLSLIQDTWREVGIAMFPRPTQRDLFRQRASAGQTVMTVWGGLDNGIASAQMSPNELAPVSQAQLQWPQWGLYAETNGESGTPPELPEVQRLAELRSQWMVAESNADRERIWHEMLQIHADNVFTIGIVNGTKQPVAHAPNLKNIPDDGIFAYQPGGFFGIYKPDTFWFDDAPVQNSSDQPGAN